MTDSYSSAGSVGPRQDAAALDKDALEAAIKAYWGDPGYTTAGIVAAIQAYVSFGAAPQAKPDPFVEAMAIEDAKWPVAQSSWQPIETEKNRD